MSFDEKYFSTHTYENISFAKFSQYWWSNRFYAILARRYGRRGGNLLEIGSGLGHLVGQLENEFETFAIDVNHWALKDSKSIVTRTPLQNASAETLPFANESFDVVIAKHVVEHLPHPDRAIAEMSRVLTPGGLLVIATPNLESLLKPWKGDRWIGYQDPTHISLHPPAKWLAWIAQSGLTLKRIFSDGFWDVPYIPVVPAQVQKFIFGSLGGIQAMLGMVFLPARWGENVMIIAYKR